MLPRRCRFHGIINLSLATSKCALCCSVTCMLSKPASISNSFFSTLVESLMAFQGVPWITEETDPPIPPKNALLTPPPTKKLKKGKLSPSSASVHLNPLGIASAGSLLFRNEYGPLATFAFPDPFLPRSLIGRSKSRLAVTNLVDKGAIPDEVFGRDYPLEYSPDGRFLLGLMRPLLAHSEDLLLMDSLGRELFVASDPMGYKNFMFTWTSEQRFVTGSLAHGGDEVLRLWDVRRLNQPVFSQFTDSTLGFELMHDERSGRSWLIGVHTEKMFGNPPADPFYEWSMININQANIGGFSNGEINITTQEFPVFGVPHGMGRDLKQFGMPYVDGGLVRYGNDSLVIVVESFNKVMHTAAQQADTKWPRFAAARTDHSRVPADDTNPFNISPQEMDLFRRDPDLFWMEGLHPDPTGSGFVIASKHLVKPAVLSRRTSRSKVVDYTSYYEITEGPDGQLRLQKTATMLETKNAVASASVSAKEWKKPNHFKFAPNGSFVGRIVEDKLRIVTNGPYARPFKDRPNNGLAELIVANEVAFQGKAVRNFAISPIDSLSCAVSATDGKIHMVQPVW